MADPTKIIASALARWKRDPVSFIEQALVNPETAQPFELYPAQRAFLREGFTPLPDGSLPFPELLFSCPKKSGKSTFAAMLLLYTVIVLGGPYAEAFCLANDEEQACGRVFEAARRILLASPLLKASVSTTANRITFTATGATITAIASDYASAAGASPSISVFDELWAYTSERARRLFDEMIPTPTRKPSVRLTVTYAGFSGESELLQALYNRALAGERISTDLYRAAGLLAYWTHDLKAPWQTTQWQEETRRQLRENQFRRMIQNEWVTAEDVFIPLAEWDAVTDSTAAPIFSSPSLTCYVAVDASLKHDSTALACVAWVNERLQLINLKTFQPSPDAPLDFENTIEATLLDWKARYHVREVRVDPWQLASTTQRLRRHAALNVVEYPQTVPNLTAMASNLYELVRSRALVVYEDADLRRAVAQAIVVESARGWVIKKEKQSHRIDPLISFAMACIGAVEGRGVAQPLRVAQFGRSPWEGIDALWGRGRTVPDDLPQWDFGFTTRDGRPIKEALK
jgi:phage terminase large subunit-like protein